LKQINDAVLLLKQESARKGTKGKSQHDQNGDSSFRQQTSQVTFKDKQDREQKRQKIVDQRQKMVNLSEAMEF